MMEGYFRDTNLGKLVTAMCPVALGIEDVYKECL